MGFPQPLSIGLIDQAGIGTAADINLTDKLDFVEQVSL